MVKTGFGTAYAPGDLTNLIFNPNGYGVYLPQFMWSVQEPANLIIC